MRSIPRSSGPVALFLALAAGTASAANTHSLSTATARGQSTLALDSRTFYTTPARITNQRLLTFPGSPRVLAVWTETTGAGSTNFAALSLNGTTFDQIAPVGATLKLRYAHFDPRAATPAIPAALKSAADNELYLVQFIATPIDEMRAQIAAAGGHIERFVVDNAHVVRMNPAAKQQVSALPFIRAISAYEPAYRMSPDVLADALAGAGPAARYSIECMRAGPAQQQAIADLIHKLGGIVDVTTPDQYRMEATLTPAQLIAVAKRNEVNYIDAWTGPMGSDMVLERQVCGAVPTLSNLGFLGQGVRGEVFDGGMVAAHEQWNGQAPLVRTSITGDSHGTACYGIIFATGNPVSQASATGLLPMREQGIFSNYNDTTQAGLGSGPYTRLALNTAAVDPSGTVRSCFQSSSVGSARVTTYTTVSAEVDDYLFRADYLSCQSQSNASGFRDSRPQAWAKNIVSIGGIDLLGTPDRGDDTWATGASIGPADDLRVKPDLSASFWNIYTTYDLGLTGAGYGNFSGTSGATPVAAGEFGLLMQMWHQGVWPGFGGGPSVFADRPRSVTAKALMINGAYRGAITAGNRLYRAYIGWGNPDLANLYSTRNKTFIVNETDPIVSGQTKTYTLTVAPGEPELRATMVYIDPAGNPAAAQDRINDLSLKVTDPSGVVYWGNNGMIATAITAPGQLDGSNYTLPGGSPNTVDTVENVFIQNPPAGSWTVQVVGSQIVQDAYPATPATDSAFALVVAGVQTGPAPCYANCDGSTVPPILNVNDFICFQTKYAAADPAANCDGSTTPPILNVNDFICFQTRFAAGCP